MFHPISCVLFCAICIQLLCISNAKRNPYINCGACIAMVDEMNWDVEHVDQKSTIQVGSFRIDSKGNQGLREIPLARSEVHLTELIEDVCSRLSNYGESNHDNGNSVYVRTSSRDGTGISLSNLRLSGDISSQLKFACETLVEEHEEEILQAFRKSEEDIVHYLCVETMDVCKPSNITEFNEATNALLSAAIHAEAEKNAAASAANSPDSSDDSDYDSDDENAKEDL